MFIVTKFTVSMVTGDVLERVGYEYFGPLEKACGASGAQKTDAANLSTSSAQIQQEAQQVFGNTSGVFSDLVNAYAPIVAAGPNQQGFSAGSLAAQNSAAITNVGTQYNNAKAAVGNAQAAVTGTGGGSALPSGANIGLNTSIATGAAATEAGELNSIQQADYATGRANFDQAAEGLAGAPQVFNASTQAENAGTNAGTAASNAENQVTSQNQSWMQAVSGALGDVTSVATAGFGKGGAWNSNNNNNNNNP